MTRQQAVRLLAELSGWSNEDVIRDPHSAWWKACSVLGEARRVVEEQARPIPRSKQ